ncbi:unnamed protein product [Rotaria sordida]|uniref:C-type lectin domain-containing protein n=1 Tax=Rotaria sordida TaxID=392033 RepID=A0A819BER1_9BILA|nr:unnamed protein product [Rotaria sordida]
MLKFFFLILFYQTTLALSYNDPCTKQCNLPGMICINSVCKCDLKNRRFWTGARCSQCPNDWKMTETACITYYETKMSWQGAEATCNNVKAELISFRDKSIIPLIYNASIKNSNMEINTRSAWTSARAINLSGLGIYKWLDKSIAPFDSKSDWWCKKTTANLGYTYLYDEPTKLLSPTNEVESCINYWRSTPNSQFRNSIGSSQKSLTMDSNIKEESIPSDINTNDDDLNLNNPPSPVKRDLHMDPKKQEENHRGGYSKQQFDEFE